MSEIEKKCGRPGCSKPARRKPYPGIGYRCRGCGRIAVAERVRAELESGQVWERVQRQGRTVRERERQREQEEREREQEERERAVARARQQRETQREASRALKPPRPLPERRAAWFETGGGDRW